MRWLEGDVLGKASRMIHLAIFIWAVFTAHPIVAMLILIRAIMDDD